MAEVILTGVTLIIVLAALSYLSFTGLSTPTSTIQLACPPGYCRTNVFSGVKECPASNTTMTYAPGFETCNSPHACESSVTPYAVQADESTSTTGACPPNTVCRCLRSQQCATHVVALYTTVNGAPTSTGNTNLYFSQRGGYIDAAGRSIGQPPYTFYPDTGEYCSIPVSWLTRSLPGCNFNQLLTAPSTIARCFARNPCISGTLAYLPQDVNAFVSGLPDTLTTTSVGCVTGQPCPDGSVAYWHPYANSVFCVNVA